MLGWHKRQAGVIQPSIRALGEDPQFSGGADNHRTLIFLLSGAELTFCRDHEWRSGVTEVPGEPAPPAKVVFTGLPKPPRSNFSPSHSRICPYFQTSGVMLVESSQPWTPGYTGKEENTEEKRIVLLPSSCWWLRRSGESCEKVRQHEKIKRGAPGHSECISSHHPQTPRNITWEHLHELHLRVPGGDPYNTAPQSPPKHGPEARRTFVRNIATFGDGLYLQELS